MLKNVHFLIEIFGVLKIIKNRSAVFIINEFQGAGIF